MLLLHTHAYCIAAEDSELVLLAWGELGDDVGGRGVLRGGGGWLLESPGVCHSRHCAPVGAGVVAHLYLIREYGRPAI